MNTDAWIERFERERAILGRLNAPEIVTLTDAGALPDQRPYYVMEWIEDGLPLDRFCQKRRLGLNARLALFQRVCTAVYYAHQQKVVHRDLKPGNILVAPDGTPKLLDFGLAKLFDEDAGTALTLARERLGTPDYMSPEQVDGLAVGPHSDQYSLGIILFELLTGRSPYDLREASFRAVEKAIKETDIPRPSRILAEGESGGRAQLPPIKARQLRGDLDDIVLTALGKEPDRRYRSVDELRQDIDRWMKHQPISARPPSIAYLAGRFVRRHLTAIALGGILTGAAIGIALLQVRSMRFIEAERLIATEQEQLAARERERAAQQSRLTDAQRARADVQQRLAEQQLLLTGATRYQMALRALESGDPQEAWQLAADFEPAVRTIVDDVSRSEMSRLAMKFTSEVADKQHLFQRDGHHVLQYDDQSGVTTNEAGAEFEGYLLTSAAHGSYIVTLDAATAVAKSVTNRQPSDSLCLLNLVRMTCRAFGKVEGEPRKGSLNPSGSYLSFVDDEGWHLLTRSGSPVAAAEGVTDAHWLSRDRLILIDAAGMSTFDVPARRRSEPIAALAGSYGAVVGAAGILAAVMEDRVVLFDYGQMTVVGAVKRAVDSLAFSHSGRKIALLTPDEDLETFTLITTPPPVPEAADDSEPGQPTDDDDDDGEDDAPGTWGVEWLATVNRGPSRDELGDPLTGSTDDEPALRHRLMFSRDDAMLLVSGSNPRLVSASSLGTLAAFRGYQGNVDAVFFSADDRVALTVHHSAGESSLHSKSGVGSRLAFRAPADAGAFSSDGRHVVLAGLDGLNVFTIDGKLERRLIPAGQRGPWSIATTPGTTDVVILQDQRLARWALNRTVALWSVKIDDSTIGLGHARAGRGRMDPALGPVWSPDGRWIAVKSGNNVIVIDARSGRTQSGSTRSATVFGTIRFSADSRQLMLGRIYWSTGGEENYEERTFTLAGMERQRDWDNSIWNDLLRETPQRLKDLADRLHGIRGRTGQMPVPADRTSCLRADRQAGGAVALSDAESGRRLISLDGFDATPHLVAMHPDSRFVLTVAGDRASVWNLGIAADTGECRGPQ